MRPIGWAKDRVRLECGECGALNDLEWSRYLTALDAGLTHRCTGCGNEQEVKDRRRLELPVEVDRRQ